MSVDRRAFLAALAAAPVAAGLAMAQQARPTMTVYKDANCGCCKAWIDHCTKAGFKVTSRDVADLNAIKRELGVPARLASCHTGVIGPYLIEGHVPADLIDKLLKEKPAGRGLAVPGMPIGSPGMEVPGATPDKYQVMLFAADGAARVFASR
jgi:hypothetical protein